MRIRWNNNVPSWIAMHILQAARERVVLTENSAGAYCTLTNAIDYIIRTHDDTSIVFFD